MVIVTLLINVYVSHWIPSTNFKSERSQWFIILILSFLLAHYAGYRQYVSIIKH